MALRQHTDLARDGTPQLHVVPSEVQEPPRAAPPVDTLGEEFLFGAGARGPSPTRVRRARPGTLLRVIVLAGLLIVLFLVVRNLTSSKAPTPPVVRAPAAVPVVAATPVGVPLSIVKSTLSPVSPPGTFRAVVTVLNANDVSADEVTVKVVLRDASGDIVTTQTKSLGVLASGKSADIVISGELDPAAAPPTGIDVSATAARLESPA